MEPTEYIWQNGEFVQWDDARVHVLTHGLHYGTGVFEGVRCYDTPNGPAIFRGLDHMQRLHRSAKLFYMDLEYTPEELLQLTKEVITRNGLTDCYIRPL
ncbi:MAG: aminotransferase class IV, partial [Thermoleophilaceae bacterium]|nr:aminotransferase class IV [Thermoleophilaceae bacterium]